MNYCSYIPITLKFPKDLIQVERNGYIFQVSKVPFCGVCYKGGRQTQVVAHRYSLGMHMIASHGNIDGVEKIRVGEKPVWNASDRTPKNYYRSGENRYNVIQGVSNYTAQTFTVTESYRTSSIRLRLSRLNSPGRIDISIQGVDGNGHPNGTKLANNIFNGNNLTTEINGTWVELKIRVNLIANTKYAIVCRCYVDNASNYARWNYQDEAMSGGASERFYSGSWHTVLDDTHAFEVYARSPLSPVSDILHDYLVTHDGQEEAIYKEHWYAQTFQASASYTLSSVKIWILRSSGRVPGILTVGIRAVDGSGHPTGADLCVGTTNGNTLAATQQTDRSEWREIKFNNSIILTSGTKYAIVARCPELGINWNRKVNGYANGNGELSTDAGTTWIALPSSGDFCFKTYQKDGTAPNRTITINQPNIFGGDKKEGGVSGNVDLMFGAITQSQNSYLVSKLGSDIPAFRGLFGAVLQRVYIGTSPYLKPWSFLLKRVNKQISGDPQWFPEKAIIRPREEAGDDLNAIHIIRECLVDKEWGLGWDTTDDIDDDFFRDAAITLHDEGFGLSMLWDQVMPVEDFIDEILNYIAGILYQDLETGKWRITLTREPTAADFVEVSYEDDDINFGGIEGTDWYAQTFKTSDTQNFVVTSVGLKLTSVGAVNDYPVIISIRATDNFSPIGADLCSKTIPIGDIVENEGGAWYKISFDTEVTLVKNTRYAIVMRLPTAGLPDVKWRAKSIGEYFDGDLFLSEDSGGTWSCDSIDADAVFKIYSHGSLYGIETFNEDDIISVEEFARPSYGEIINTVTVNWWDKIAHKSRPATARDIALIEKEGGAIIEKVLNYQGICNAALANRVAERELKLASSMLAGLRLKCTRKMSHLKPNGIFMLSWSNLGITQMVVRVLNVNYGNLEKNEVILVCVEDSFSTAETIYGDAPDTLWVDPITDPADVINKRLIEIPYWTLCNNIIGSVALVAALDNDTGFLCVVAEKPSVDSFDYNLLARLSASYDFKDLTMGNSSFTPAAVIADALALNAVDISTLNLSSESDLDLVEDGTYAIIENEIIKVNSVDVSNNQINVSRGLLDTVPEAHSSGVRIYFMELKFGEVEAEYTNGDTPSVKLLPRTPNGTLVEEMAIAETADALDSRLIKPYPPGNLKFNAESYPKHFSSGAYGNKIILSWNHRDRTAVNQLQSLAKHTDGNIGARETGVTYSIKVYSADGVTEGTNSPYTGETGTSWDYTEGMEAADFGALQSQLRFVVYAVRGGYSSWNNGYDITIERSLRGTTTGESGTAGWLIPYFDGRNSIKPNGSASGSLDTQPELGSSIVEITGVSGSLGSVEVAIQLISSAVEASGADGTLRGTTRKLISAAVGVSGADGSLNLQSELVGSAVGISGADGSLNVAISLVGSAAGVSGAAAGDFESPPSNP